MICHRIILYFLFILIPGYTIAQGEGYGQDSIIRQADRILIESNDPEALFTLFTETLHIPVAWPMRDHGTYTSGSVNAGDVTLEFYSYGTSRIAGSQARYTSLFLEPYSLEEALRKLRIKGIPYDKPEFHGSTLPDGSKETEWTTVKLPTLSSNSLPVTLFEYSPLFLNMEVRRIQFGNRMTLNGGGPLGIVSTHSIVLESEEPEGTEAEWIRFLKKPEPDGRLKAERGPAFRTVPGLRRGIQRIVFKVKSLAGAEAFLREHRLLGEKEKEEVFFKTSSVQGLKISLKE